MNAIAKPTERRLIFRVLTCVTAPVNPQEIHELAAADVIVDRKGPRLEASRAETFRLDDGAHGGTRARPCM